MTQTITGLFDDYGDAEAAVRDLEAAGVPHGDISLVAGDATGDHAGRRELAAVHASDDAGRGAGVGAAIGGVGGLLAGLGLLAIPGIGPVVAAGWLASTALGAVGGAAVGAATGGLVGALTEAGVDRDDAHVYAEGVRRGGVLVTARVDDSRAGVARRVLASDRSVDLAARRDAYRGEGWSRFDEAAAPYSREQVVAERARWRR